MATIMQKEVLGSASLPWLQRASVHSGAATSVPCSRIANVHALRASALYCIHRQHLTRIGSGLVNCNKVNHRRTSLAKAAVEEAEKVAPSPDEYLPVQERADELSALLGGTNIYLIGMMGSGKTTIGKILTQVLGYCFFDSDAMVEKAEGVSVATIFSERGEQAFRDLESQVIAQLATMEGLIVATGGGAILRAENWRWMRLGVTVWIDVPLEALAKRVVAAGIKSRPILSQGASDQDAYYQALDKLRSLFQKRKDLYARADVRISLEAIAKEIGSTVESDISPARIALAILREVKVLLSQRSEALEWESAGLEGSEPDASQYMLLYGLEKSEQEGRTQEIVASH